jgi:glycosyltransferase involved in cell wall biosynthesis
MRILIASVQVPFVRGGAEILAEGLCDALRAAGHEAEVVTVPFKWYPPERILDQMLACRLFDLTDFMATPVDRVIGLKFPAYLIPHPNKVLWLLHQHRTAYDLWGHPDYADLNHHPHGQQVRDAIHLADRQLIPECRAVYTISANVSRRLTDSCGIDSAPLYHPPGHAEQFRTEEAEDYLFFPSRLNPTKRQGLVLQALALTRRPVRVRFAGRADTAAHGEELQAAARKLGVDRRVEWLGPVSDNEKRRGYARAMGVVFPPSDEDYGYITLEAMLASKAVVTCTDSGGSLEFVVPGWTGLVAEPTPEALAAALDALWEDRERARAWGLAGRARYDELDISWANVVRRLAA